MGGEKGRCVILAGGPIEEELQGLLCPQDIIYAADAGLAAARRFGLRPAVCLGDWDSCPQPPAGEAGELLVLPAEKDDTDTHYAARLAAERGFKQVLLLGCLGGRLDHTLANLSTLLWLTGQGVRCWAVGQGAAVTAVENGRLCLPRREQAYLSVFAAGGAARGVSLSGVRYPLQDAVLTEQFPIGVSNEFAGPQAQIEVKQGRLLVLYCRRQ